MEVGHTFALEIRLSRDEVKGMSMGKLRTSCAKPASSARNRDTTLPEDKNNTSIYKNTIV